MNVKMVSLIYGQWKLGTMDSGEEGYYCSICGNYGYAIEKEYVLYQNYCCQCGAKMRE